jgi:glucosamine--fructose-6-phosphate aminotransferase (isomerizing)
MKERSVSTMFEEALEAPEVVERQLADSALALYLAESLASQPRAIVATVARSSGAHAAHYFSTLALTRLGLPAPPLPDSLPTRQRAALRMDGLTALAFSQTGKKLELARTMATLGTLGTLGARTIALVNAGPSPLGKACESQLPLLAGEEAGATAMKSHIGMLSRSAQLVGYWARFAHGDRALLEALKTLPQKMAWACMQDWDAGLEILAEASQMYVIAGSTGLGVAREAALTLKVECGICADAFSCAEFVHGPGRLVARDTPVLVFAPRGPEQAALIELATRLRSRGTTVLLAAPSTTGQADLPIVCTDDPALDSIAAMQSFYVMAARLAENGTRSLPPARQAAGYAEAFAPAGDHAQRVQV